MGTWLRLMPRGNLNFRIHKSKAIRLWVTLKNILNLVTHWDPGTLLGLVPGGHLNFVLHNYKATKSLIFSNINVLLGLFGRWCGLTIVIGFGSYWGIIFALWDVRLGYDY